jgi:hypothetical protein
VDNWSEGKLILLTQVSTTLAVLQRDFITMGLFDEEESLQEARAAITRTRAQLCERSLRM